MNVLLRWLRYDFLSNEVDWRRKELTTLLTWIAPSSRPSSASSADALAPVSTPGISHEPYSISIRNQGVRTDFDGAEGDHGTVNLVDGAIDLFQIVGVGDDLVTGEDILYE